MGRIDQDTVQRILDAADIVEVVGDFVKLRRSGANYKGLCPFHNERTPSFSVNKARNICKCFSCGKGGSPVNFIMEHEQMSYQEALRYLARKYNIEIEEKEQTAAERQAQSRREALMAVNAFALDFFELNLRESAEGRDIAQAYLRHRGISEAMAKRFHLGYAPDSPTALVDAARQAGYAADNLLATGLAYEKEREGSTAAIDRFRGRLIFPIHTLSGRVVGFGGRTMRSDKNIAKYVNSPESEIYHKKNELYGLYQARQAIVRRDKCIMVEGYLDVISMHQAGVENVVASSGTSLTEEQIRAVGRFTDNITLIYDADPAGIKASMRGINMLLAEKFNVRTLRLPPGDDPDSFAQTHSAGEVEDYLARNEQDIVSFMVSVLTEGLDSTDPMAKAKVVNEVLRSIAWVDEPVKRQEYISQCSRLLDVPEEVLIGQLNIFISKRYEERAQAAKREEARQSIRGAENEESAAAETPETSEADEKAADVPLLKLDVNRLRPYEEMLVRYVVRYGLLMICDEADDSGAVAVPVFDVIDQSLAYDGISFTEPAFAATFEAMRTIRRGIWEDDRRRRLAEIEAEWAAEAERRRDAIRSSAASMEALAKEEALIQADAEAFAVRAINEFDTAYGQTRLINSADDTVRSTALELMEEKYSLSRIYTRNQDLADEQEQIAHLVWRAVCELRGAILAGMIDDLGKQLASLPADDTEGATQILTKMVKLKELQRDLGHALGERIILPRR